MTHKSKGGEEEAIARAAPSSGYNRFHGHLDVAL
jgi:hypothetical protein